MPGSHRPQSASGAPLRPVQDVKATTKTQSMTYQTISVEVRDSFAWCKLNRPDVRNAFNQTMIEELTDFAEHITSETRAVVLYGEGSVFCAGGDLHWMQRSLEMNQQQNLEDAKRLAAMYS